MNDVFSVESILFKDSFKNTSSNTVVNTSKSMDELVYDAYKSEEDLKFYETYTMINDYNTNQKIRMLKRLNNVTNKIKNRNINNSCESYLRSLEEETADKPKEKENIFIRILKGFIKILTFIPRMIIKGIRMFIEFIKRKKAELDKKKPEERVARNNSIYQDINYKKQELCDKYRSEWLKATELIKSGKDYDGYSNEFRTLCLNMRNYFEKLKEEVKRNNDIISVDKNNILQYIEDADYMVRTNYDKFEHDVRHFKKSQDIDIEKDFTNIVKNTTKTLNDATRKERDSFNNLKNSFNKLENTITTNFSTKKKYKVTADIIKKVYYKYFKDFDETSEDEAAAIPFVDYHDASIITTKPKSIEQLQDYDKKLTDTYKWFKETVEKNEKVNDEDFKKVLDKYNNYGKLGDYDSADDIMNEMIAAMGINPKTIKYFKSGDEISSYYMKMFNRTDGPTILRNYINTNFDFILKNEKALTEHFKNTFNEIDKCNKHIIKLLDDFIKILSQYDINESHMKIMTEVKKDLTEITKEEKEENKLINQLLIKELAFFTDLLKETGLEVIL